MPRQDEPIDFVAALAKLLADATLRQSFQADPESVADSLRVRDEDRPGFIALDPRQLEEQAETLIRKRWHEVRQLAPETVKTLGDNGFEVFRFYATNVWPEGHHRHRIDALQFVEFLAANGLQRPDRQELRRLRRWTERH